MWGGGAQWQGKSPEVRLFCMRYSHSKILQFLCQMLKDNYRLGGLFQILLLAFTLERINHTSLKYLLTGKELTQVRSRPTQLQGPGSALSGYTWNTTGTPSPPPTQNGCVSGSKVSPASAERKHSYSAASFTLTYLTGNPDWPSRMKYQLL